MGWNDVESGADPLFAGTTPAQFYFLHSFVVVPRESSVAIARRRTAPISSARCGTTTSPACNSIRKRVTTGASACCSTSHPAEPMLRTRIIPSLLIHRNGLVKTVRFSEPRYVGDPLNAVRIFNEKQVDELVVFDIDATPTGAQPNLSLIQRLASECRMPLCYGGGVNSLEQIEQIIALGVEKVALASALVSASGPPEPRRYSRGPTERRRRARCPSHRLGVRGVSRQWHARRGSRCD